MLSVAIAVDPPAEISAAQQVTRSCEQAIGDGRCRDAERLAPADVVTWFAVVSLAVSELRIEFHDRKRDGALVESRVLAFSERDAEGSRWESAGAVIAAFVAARDSATTPPPPPVPRVVAPPPLPPAPGLAYNVDLALFTGPALDRGGYRWGGVGRAYLAVPNAPQVLALVSLRYAERPGDLALSYWGAAAGLGARLARRDFPVAAELTGELSFERVGISARDAANGRQEQAHQNRFGGRLSFNVSCRLAGPLGVVAGVEADALRPAISVQVGDENEGRAPAVTHAFTLGVRWFGGQ